MQKHVHVHAHVHGVHVYHCGRVYLCGVYLRDSVTVSCCRYRTAMRTARHGDDTLIHDDINTSTHIITHPDDDILLRRTHEASAAARKHERAICFRMCTYYVVDQLAVLAFRSNNFTHTATGPHARNADEPT
jgi:hypothetical protein